MLAKSPQEAVRLLDEAFQRGDVDALLSYYEHNATMVVRPGMLATGTAELRRTFETILASFAEPPAVVQEKVHVIEVGDIALFTSKWNLIGQAVSGEKVERTAYASAVFRKQSDGGWKLVVDNSLGPAVLD